MASRVTPDPRDMTPGRSSVSQQTTSSTARQVISVDTVDDSYYSMLPSGWAAIVRWSSFIDVLYWNTNLKHRTRFLMVTNGWQAGSVTYTDSQFTDLIINSFDDFIIYDHRTHT